MAVSKRTRYEVLRRDNHTCRYCRATDTPLTVDHVTPVALGGTDDPSNLVAACKDCNAGKSSASPGAALVADVQEDALRHAEMIKQAYAVIVDRMGKRDEYLDQFVEVYTGSAPTDWTLTVGRWFEMGVPIEIVQDAATIAMNNPRVTQSGRFAYMCGIIWKQVHAVQEAVELKAAIAGSFITETDLDDIKYEAWSAGYEAGAKQGREETGNRLGFKDGYHRILCDVVDRGQINGAPPLDEFFQGPQIDLTPSPWAA